MRLRPTRVGLWHARYGSVRTRKIETIVIAAGLTLLSVWGGAWIYRSLSSRAAIKQFEKEQAHAPTVNARLVGDPVSSFGVDFSLWSPKRIQQFRDSVATKTDQPLAVLRIPNIHLEVPLYNDTDDLTLDRGVGRILGTAHLGEIGNLGIAGHRDGFFRGLKDLTAHDEIDLVLTGRSDVYQVENIQIVNPEDVSVLAPTPAPALTLVTCYPFYFIGSAPQRYIVRASLKDFDQSQNEVSQSKSEVGRFKTKEKEK
jgi:sortase A